MGLCLECLSGSAADDSDHTPDAETRRAQIAQAAEKRKHDSEGRGVKDPEGLKRKQKRREELERKSELTQNAGQEEKGLRWQVG
ncbi:small VCP/p97-interacting protein-like [Liolophura sinensis]|uniref:small VCP/p97-interacting protein-like n=1 Tax=Liolophura sinensis TaxID=3198878 RepID=UPI00315813BA